ncbi:MAG: PAS domain-containing protein [Deltaproteobacteria bacterium]|nr:PAS domain-containing protein [Deltaproteobacteria bacterium]
MAGIQKGEISRDINAWLDLIHPEDSVELENAVELHRTSIEPIQYEYRVRHKDGTYRHLNDHGLPLLDDKGCPYKWVGVYTDITERKRAEEALRESEEKLARSKKMESLGLLAGGVAHDLNNVLSGIVSYPELILMTFYYANNFES